VRNEATALVLGAREPVPDAAHGLYVLTRPSQLVAEALHARVDSTGRNADAPQARASSSACVCTRSRFSSKASSSLLGMAAYFAATVRAPLTAIVLIAEMTGGYVLMLPLLIACVAPYAMADALGDLPIYERLVERELLRRGGRSTLESPRLVDLRLFPGAPLEGKEVRELALPKACLLVSAAAWARRDRTYTRDLPPRRRRLGPPRRPRGRGCRGQAARCDPTTPALHVRRKPGAGASSSRVNR
jgi:hypothetical protein